MNGERYGKCVNIGNCSLADKRDTIKVLAGQDYVCSECGKGLVATASRPNGGGAVGGGGGIPKNALIAGGALLALLLFGFLGWRIFGQGGLGGGGSSSSSTSSSSGGSGATPILRLGGSNTIGDKLAAALVEAYFREIKGCGEPKTVTLAKDEFEVSCTLNGTENVVRISAHGTKTGFAELGDGKIDIAMASDQIDAEQASKLASLGVMTSAANEHVIGLDGIAIVSNKANPVPELSVRQVADVFSGKIRDWAEVGGRPGPISIHARDDNSGTWKFFKTKVLETSGVSLSPDAKRYEKGTELAAAVAGDVGAIGQVGVASAGETRPIAISTSGVAALEPNRMTIGTEAYLLRRRLYLYTAANPKNPEVNAFLSFVASSKGEAVVGSNGFVPLTIVKDGAPSTVPANAPEALREFARNGARRLSTTFFFESGSYRLDTRGLQDLKGMANSLKPQDRLMLFGFTDNVGDDRRNKILSVKRADTVAEALRYPNGINPDVIDGFGEAIPVDDNGTEEGRKRNRRVEVWVRE